MTLPERLDPTVVLIPAHDEAATISGIVAGVRALGLQVLVIDDGSRDGTAGLAAAAGALVVSHPQNAGKGIRLHEGLAAAFARGALRVVTMDADGQHQPGDLPALLAAAREDALVTGDRSASMRDMPRVRALAIRFGNVFIGRACGQRLGDAQCGLRIYPRLFHDRVRIPPRQRRHFVYETAALMHAAEAGLALVPVPVPARYAGVLHRPSHFRPIRDFLRIFGCVTAFLVTRRLQMRGVSPVLRPDPQTNGTATQKETRE